MAFQPGKRLREKGSRATHYVFSSHILLATVYDICQPNEYRVSPNSSHPRPHTCGQAWPARGSHLLTGQRADVEEKAVGDLPHHEGQVQNLNGQLGHSDGVVVVIGDAQDILARKTGKGRG